MNHPVQAGHAINLTFKHNGTQPGYQTKMQKMLLLMVMDFLARVKLLRAIIGACLLLNFTK